MVLVGAGGNCDVEAVAGQVEAVVACGHAVPREGSSGEVVHELSWARAGFHVSHVVHADVPGGSQSPERVGEAAGGRVLFEDEDACPGGACEQSGRGQ